MNVDFAFICDYAEAREKINALGIGFDTIYAPTLPALHARFYVVAQLRFSSSEIGVKELNIELIDADGKDVIKPVVGRIQVDPPPEGTFDKTARFTMAFDGIELKNYGDHVIRIRIDGKEIVNIPLKVVEPPKAG